MPVLIRHEIPWGPTKPPYGTKVNGAHPLAQGMIGCWLINEAAGKTIYDLTENGGDGTVHGTTWTTGIFGNALAFDGTSNYVGTALEVPHGAHTVALWVKKDGSRNGWIVAQRNNAAGFWQFFCRPDSSDRQMHYYNGTTVVSGVAAVSDGIWHHVAVTHDGTNTVTFYLDGVKDTAVAESLGGFVATPVTFQWDGVSAFANGTLDAVVIYNRALSAAEIAQLYAEPFCFMEPDEYWLAQGASVAVTYPAIQPIIVPPEPFPFSAFNYL